MLDAADTAVQPVLHALALLQSPISTPHPPSKTPVRDGPLQQAAVQRPTPHVMSTGRAQLSSSSDSSQGALLATDDVQPIDEKVLENDETVQTTGDAANVTVHAKGVMDDAAHPAQTAPGALSASACSSGWVLLPLTASPDVQCTPKL